MKPTAKNKKNILTVDDERIMQKMMQKILSKHGYNAIPAANGKEALEKLIFHDIDLIILDIMMPVMDGFETLRMLKQMSKTRYIPVVILTANANVRTFSRVVKMGADDFIAKPFDQSNLRRKLDYLLQDVERRKEELELMLEDEKTTTDLDPEELKAQKEKFIFGFEKLFPKMVFLVSHQNGKELKKLLTAFEKKCEAYELEKASRLAFKIMFTIDQHGDWEDVVHFLEDIYEYFQEIMIDVVL